MSVFATDRIALAICDRCGQRSPHRMMRMETNKSLVCQICFDGNYDIINHPLNYPPPVSPDPEAIENPRPDSGGRSDADGTWTVTLTTGR